MSSTLKILDREYSFIPSDKGLNYILANEYKEIFIDIFEITCGVNKLIAEKVDAINGDPVIKINTQFEGKEYATLFVVQKGDDHNIILNVKSLGNGRDVYVTEKNIVEEIAKEVEIPQLTKSVTEYTQPVHKSIEVDIEQYKADAIRVIGENFTQKKQKIEQLQESLTSLINDRLLKLADSTAVDVDNISKIILEKVDHSIQVNRIDKDSTLAEINSIRENILTTVELYNNSFTQTANEKTTQLVELQEKVNFEVNTKLAELDVETKSQLQHVTEAYDSIRTFIANTKEEFLNEKTSNAATIEKLFETAKHTVTTNIKRAENLVGKKLSKLQSITDKKINDITSIIESKISYFDEKSQELQTSVDESNSALSESVQKAINQIAVESQDKLLDFDRTKEEINDLVKSNNVDLQNLKTQFTEAIDKKIKDIKSVAISKEDLNQLKKQIESRFETETANIKKYVASYGGGGGAGSGNQTLSFNEVTAALSISNGNTISLSSLNGGITGNYLPLTGGTVTGNVTVNGQVSATTMATNYIDFTPLTAAPIHVDGRLYYDQAEQTLVFWDGDPTLKYPINKMLWTIGVNKTGSTIPKGTVVYLSGAQGNRGKMWPAQASNDLRSADTIGVTMQSTAINQEGYIMAIGELVGIDTRAFAEGTTLYLSPTAAGGITDVKPQAPNHIVKVGFSLNSTVNGKIYVEIDNGYELNELHNVRINGVSGGQGLIYNAASALWVNSDLYNGSDLKALSANWQNTYTSFSAQSANNAYLPLTGGTMTGPLTLQGVPLSVNNNNAHNATLHYDRLEFENTDEDWHVQLYMSSSTPRGTSIALPNQSGQLLADTSNLPAAKLTGTIANARLPVVMSGLSSVASTTFVGRLAGTASGNLPLTGGTVTGATRFDNNVTIFGNLSCSGTQTFNNTVFSTTSAVSVVHVGSGPALWVGNNGTGDIASFYDIDENIEILHVGGNNGSFPNVGVKTSTPNVDFTVNGEISASSTIYSLSGNSNEWNSSYSNVNSNSAYWQDSYNKLNMLVLNSFWS